MASLATIASISPYFLERIRKVRFKKLDFNTMPRSQLSKISCYFTVYGRSSSSAATLDLSRYVKDLHLSADISNCYYFNEILSGCSLNLDSFEVQGSYDDTGLSILDNNCIKEFKRFQIDSHLDEEFLDSFPQYVLNKVLEVEINKPTEDHLELIHPILNKLKSMKTLKTSILSNNSAPMLTIPIQTLELEVHPDSSPRCFKYCAISITVLHLMMCECSSPDEFISSLSNLQELTLNSDELDESSTIATLQIASKLADIRKVTFLLIDIEFRIQSIEFSFLAMSLVAVYFVFDMSSSEESKEALDGFIPNFIDTADYIPERDFSSRVLGQKGEVSISCKTTDGVVVPRDMFNNYLVSILLLD